VHSIRSVLLHTVHTRRLPDEINPVKRKWVRDTCTIPSHHSHTIPQPHTPHTSQYIRSIACVQQQEGVMRGARLLMRSVHPLYAASRVHGEGEGAVRVQHTVVDRRHTMVQPGAEGWCAAPTTCCFTSSAPPIAGFTQTHDRSPLPPPERCHHHITSTIPPHQQDSTSRTPANAERPPTRPHVLPQGDIKRRVLQAHRK
jgi:hypothetical protein